MMGRRKIRKKAQKAKDGSDDNDTAKANGGQEVQPEQTKDIDTIIEEMSIEELERRLAVKKLVRATEAPSEDDASAESQDSNKKKKRRQLEKDDTDTDGEGERGTYAAAKAKKGQMPNADSIKVMVAMTPLFAEAPTFGDEEGEEPEGFLRFFDVVKRNALELISSDTSIIDKNILRRAKSGITEM